MNRSAPRRLSRPTLTKMPAGSLMLSRAACISRGTWCSFETTRRARSGERRVVEQHLPGEAGREQIAVVLGVALPRAHRFELEEPRADVGVERRPLEALDLGQARRVDRGQPARERAEIADLRVNRRPAEILEQVVVQVNAVERRVGWVRFVEPREVLVDEVRQGFGGIHLVESAPRAWPASCMWSPRPSATSRM